MSKLSKSMEEGTILTWIIGNGYPVAQSDEIVEIETDKMTVTHVSDADGILHIVMPEGSRCDVGAVIAHIGESANQTGNIGQSAAPESPTMEVALLGARECDPMSVAAGSISMLGPSHTSKAGPATTPLGRRSALIHGIDLDTVKATGPQGRVTQSEER